MDTLWVVWDFSGVISGGCCHGAVDGLRQGSLLVVAVKLFSCVIYMSNRCHKLARACGVPVGRHSGGQLATTLVATKNDIFFSFLFPSFTFLIEGALGSKTLFRES